MAGLVGWVGSDEDRGRSDLEGALALLRHDRSFRSRIIAASRGLLLGATFREGAAPDVVTIDEKRLTVAVYGHPLIRSPQWGVAAAEWIGDRYLEKEVRFVGDLDGSFLIVIVDAEAGLLRIINDRTGSMPMAYASSLSSFAIAPEAKPLFGLLGMEPELDEGAALAFVNFGYSAGEQTVFRGVRQLAPASVLDVDIASGRAASEQYWQLGFRPRSGLGAREAAGELLPIVQSAHRAVLADEPERVQLLLTGGLDSRSILGTLVDLGRPPDEALTWGVRDDIPASDPVIARVLAGQAKVPFRFLRYDADTFVDHAAEWCRISELTSDNLGNFAAGPDFLSRTMTPGSVLIVGDQMLGPGGLPRDVGDAISAVTKTPFGGLLPVFEDAVRAGQRTEVDRVLRGQIDGVVSGCSSDHPKDVQDFLFFHLYVMRWLWAPAYFREPMVSVRRPLMTNDVVDFATELPRHLRVDKGVLQKMMRTSMPGLMRERTASAHSLVDWDFETRRPGQLRDLFFELVNYDRVAQTPLGGFIDPDGYQRLITAYFDTVPAPIRRNPPRFGRLYSIRRVASGIPAASRAARYFEPLAKRLVGLKPYPGAGTVVRRIALLSLMAGLMNDGGFLRHKRAV